MRFVDANVFLRAITGDDQSKAQACRRFFREGSLAGENMTTAETIIAELAYNLVSPRQYGLSHEEAAARIMPYIALRGLYLPTKSICARAVDLFASHSFLDIEDAFTVARMEAEGMSELVSYDKDFDRIPTIRRVEP